MIGYSILFELLLMLLLGKILGDMVHRLGFSPLIGQIIAGILIGPMILNQVTVNPDLNDLSDLSIIFMMFLMGLSIDFEKVMSENVYKASIISVIGGFLTFFTATTITTLLGFDLNASILVGISFISTSTAIGFMVLRTSAITIAKSSRPSWRSGRRTISSPCWPCRYSFRT